MSPGAVIRFRPTFGSFNTPDGKLQSNVGIWAMNRRGPLGGAIEIASLFPTSVGQANSTTFAPNQVYSLVTGQEIPFSAANPKAAVDRRTELIDFCRIL